MESVFPVSSEKNRAKNIQFIYFTFFSVPGLSCLLKKVLDQICKGG